MWAIRILSGAQAGQIFPLQQGKHTVGRGSACEIKINSTSVSKEHAVVLVTGDKVIITDLHSRNGTYVNGVKIQNQRISLGDKLSLHDVLLDIVQVPDSMSAGKPMVPAGGVYATPPPAWSGNAAVRLQNDYGYPAQSAVHHPAARAAGANPHLHAQAGQHQQVSAQSLSGLLYNFKIYIDNVAMPGVYAVAQSMPFRYALAAMVAIYVVLVTALSTVPVITTTRDNIRLESVRRAKTIARHMAATNRQAIIDRNELAISVRTAELEEGVTTAVLVSAKDGTIIAPANKRGEFVNKPFVNKARREDREINEFIDDSSLGVSVPISAYSSETGNQSVIAYSIVLYDLGALAMNNTQTFVMFVQNLAMALLVGALFYFFLYKVVEHPIETMNSQLDDALREGRDDLKTDYQFPSLERLASNINSALSRIGQSDQGPGMSFAVDRDSEARNMVRMLTSAAISVNALDDRIISTNTTFDRLIGGGVSLQGRPLSDIPDFALQENLRDLIPRMREANGDLALSRIPFPNGEYEVCGQSVMGNSEPAYYLIVLNPMGDT
jgi:hypothetical protein